MAERYNDTTAKLWELLDLELPEAPGKILGTALVEKLAGHPDLGLSAKSLQYYVSQASKDVSSPIAKVTFGQGYYRRPIGDRGAGVGTLKRLELIAEAAGKLVEALEETRGDLEYRHRQKMIWVDRIKELQRKTR